MMEITRTLYLIDEGFLTFGELDPRKFEEPYKAIPYLKTCIDFPYLTTTEEILAKTHVKRFLK